MLKGDTTRELEVAIAAGRGYLTEGACCLAGCCGWCPCNVDTAKRHLIGNVGAIYLKDKLHPFRCEIEASPQAEVDIIFAGIPRVECSTSRRISDFGNRHGCRHCSRRKRKGIG